MKTFLTISAAVAIVSLGSLASAQAGGATSAPSRYFNNEIDNVNLAQIRHHRVVQAADVRITEFSSSSAKSSASKR